MVRLAALLLALSPSVFAGVGGNVYNQYAAPISGARITAFRPATIHDERVRVAGGMTREPLAVATANDDGLFALDTKRGGMIELLIEAGDYAPQVFYALDGETDLVITLEDASMRTGVVTANGKPVANVLVVAGLDGLPFWMTKSDAKGMFSVARPVTETGLWFIHPDYAVHGATHSLNAQLSPGTRVEGKVTRGGKPVSGARILIDGWPVATSGEDGTFAIAHASEKATSIEAVLGDERGSAQRAGHVEIELARGKSITGSVRDVAKKPLAGALVVAQTESGMLFSAVADDRGNYRIEPLAANDYLVTVQSAGEIQYAEALAKLRANETARIDFNADARVYVRGVVVDEDRKPVAGAYVSLIPGSRNSPRLYGLIRGADAPIARSGADGRFKFEINSTFSGELQAVHPRYAVAALEIQSAAKPVTITMRNGIEVPGIVVDADGKPVAGAAIAAVENPGDTEMLIEDALAHESYLGALVTTDEEGRFVAHFNDALHDVGAWKVDFSGTTIRKIKPERGMKPLRIVLERGVEIRGRVIGKSPGTKLLGGISVTSETGSERGGASSQDGTFVIGSLRPGTYQLVFANLDRQMVEKTVTAPASDVVLELAERGEVRGRVVDAATRTPLPHFSIMAMGHGTAYNAETFDNVETFSIKAEAGPIEVMANAPGYTSQTLNAIVNTAKAAELSFALTRARTITGRIVDELGAPISAARVMMMTKSSDSYGGHAQTDKDGMYALEDVTREAAELSIAAHGYLGRRIAVSAGGDERVDVRLPRGRKAIGRVVAADGAPVESAEVWGMTRSGDPDDSQPVRSDSDGSFEMQGLGLGRIDFRATHPDHGTIQLDDVDIDKAPVVLTFKAAGATGTIHGKVLDYEKQKWTNASVQAGERSGQVARDGTYRIERVPAGDVPVRVQVANMRIQAYTAPRIVQLAPGSDLELNLRAGSDITLRGTVSEGGVAMPAGAMVNFSGASNWVARVGDNGTYELTGIEPGAYDVHVMSGQRSFQTRYIVSGSATYDITVAFTEIEGHVLANGAPVAGVDVELTPQGAQYGDTETTDANGTFRFSVAQAPSYVISASKTGYANAVRRIDRTNDPIVLELIRADGLRVKLVDARNGKTLQGYAVATHPSGLIAGSVNELQDGALSLPLLPGTYRVSVSSGGFASQSMNVTVPRQGELQFGLTPGGTLIVNADRGAGELVKLVLPNGEEYVRCQCNRIAEIRLEGPQTKIENVAPGSYTMHVYDAEGRIKSSQAVTIAEGQTTTAAIHVPE